jgi:hypothetical protein
MAAHARVRMVANGRLRLPLCGDLCIICGRAGTTITTPLARLLEEMTARGARIDPQPAAAQPGSTAQTGKTECTISN